MCVHPSKDTHRPTFPSKVGHCSAYSDVINVFCEKNNLRVQCNTSIDFENRLEFRLKRARLSRIELLVASIKWVWLLPGAIMCVSVTLYSAKASI